MNKTDIEWADMTWNPVVGCKRGCEYCYARRYAKRFGGYDKSDGTITTHCPLPRAELHQPLTITRRNGKTVNSPFPFGFEPTLLRYRLEEPQHIKEPQTIFVGSMTDLFGRWVPTRWILEVLDACAAAPQHRYMFLTKNPERYAQLDELALLPHKDNFWYGSTVTGKGGKRFNGHILLNTFLSIEPCMNTSTLASAASAATALSSSERRPETGPGRSSRRKRGWITSSRRQTSLMRRSL